MQESNRELKVMCTCADTAYSMHISRVLIFICINIRILHFSFSNIRTSAFYLWPSQYIIGIARGCSGCTCTPQGGEKKFRRNLQAKFVSAPPAHQVHPTGRAKVNF